VSDRQFQKVEPADFTVTLFFDSYEEQEDVRKSTDAIARLLLPTVGEQKAKLPPVCIFSWGNFGYKGIVSRVEQRFIMFLATGIPVRAELTVIFKAIITKEEDALYKAKEACRKIWTVRTGDRLDLVAHQALGNPLLWREIARTNRIHDPLRFPAQKDIGTALIIPDLW
jgi:hypothetical protein